MPSPLPAKIDRYEIIDRLGRGGMSVVYRARDPRIGRTVAIKVLTVPEDERFEREARAIGALRHEHIVTIYDSGEFENWPYLVMEYIEGATLAELIDRGTPMSVRHKLALVRDLALALDYAHSFGIVHRDIKPANLIIDRRGSLKILDFGIARMLDAPMTRTGDLVGTPNYMSPEQIEEKTIDRRTDVFAVGLTMYELLSGRKAFPGTTIIRIASAILTEQPEPLARLCAGLDPALEQIVNTAIQKDPANRYQTLEMMAADIAQVLPRYPATDTALDGDDTTRIQPTPIPGKAAVALPRSGGTPVPSAPRAVAVVDPTPVAPTPPVVHVHASKTWIGLVAIAIAIVIVGGLAALSWRRSDRPENRDAPRSDPGSPRGGGAGAFADASKTSRESAGAQPAPPAAVAPAASALPSEPSPPASTPTGTIAARGSSKRGTSAARAAISSPVAPSLPPEVRDMKSACDRGDASKCEALGRIYEAGQGIDRDGALAAGLYGRACEGGRESGCNLLGLMYLKGSPDVPQNGARAAEAFERGCKDGLGIACSNLALMYQRGTLVSKNEGRALELFDRACKAGDGMGCFGIGVAQEVGGPGIPKDLKKAFGSFEKSCAANNAAGCNRLGVMYAFGRTVDVDKTKALSLFERACIGGNGPGCNNVGLGYQNGQGTAQDPQQAAKWFKRACELDFRQACTNLGALYHDGAGVPHDDVEADRLFRRACELGGGIGCLRLGAAYEAGTGVTKDDGQAADIYRRACEASLAAEACTRLAAMYDQGRGVSKDPALSAKYARLGRDLGRAPGTDTSSEEPTPGNARGGGVPSPVEIKPEAPSGARLATGESVRMPTKIKDELPTYPKAAQYAHVQGIVVIEATIGGDGKVTGTKVIQSIPLLDGAAEEAVKRWQYEPTIVRGQPVPIVIQIPVKFELK